jgi:hypothetical protein
MSEWHLGEVASCHATMDEAISLAKELNDANAIARGEPRYEVAGADHEVFGAIRNYLTAVS